MSGFLKDMESKADFYKLLGASVEQVSQAEASLNLKFADEYKEYLMAFGMASANAHEFTGICDSSRLNVVDVTVLERQRNPSVPLEYYVVEQVNIDRIVVWQSSTGEIYETAKELSPVKICDSLCEYLNN